MSIQVKTPTHEQFDSNSSRDFHADPSHHNHNTLQLNQSAKKRRQSNYQDDVFDNQPNKKRRHGGYKLPTKFHLGGSISDPLNLNQVDGEESSTPVPIPAPKVDRVLPALLPVRPVNLTDPLNLSVESLAHDTTGPMSPSGIRKKRKKLTKKKLEKLEIDFNNEETTPTEDVAFATGASNADIPENTISGTATTPEGLHTVTKRRETLVVGSGKKNRLRRDSDRSCGAVSGPEGKKPPGPSTPAKGDHTKTAQGTGTTLVVASPGSKWAGDSGNLAQGAKGHANKTRFSHGNYNRYYGYRNVDSMEQDPRIQAFKPEWFKGKEVLDIGCNIGHITLSIAKDFHPRRIIGLDIDQYLVTIARRNIRHYADQAQVAKKFPESMPIVYGPLNEPMELKQQDVFPANVSFLQGNYLLESDTLLEMVQPEFDVILALSVTKWIHLNNGDAGLKRCFRRMFLQLRPGGALLLEPQQWASYKKRKHLTEKIRKTFETILLKPDQFTEYLLSEVGFSTCEKLTLPHHQCKGFRRPVFIFRKADDKT